MLSHVQFDMMERNGFVTVDGPFEAREVAAAAAATDGVFEHQPEGEGFAGCVLTPELLRLIQHPEIEAVAKQMLRAADVFLWTLALRKTRARPLAEPKLEREHADIRYTAADLDASPRRVLCAVLLWLTDVTPRRAPLVYRPGSHRQLADTYTDRAKVAAFNFDQLPPLNYAPLEPLLARAGQISVGTTGVIHSGSVNTDTEDRKVLFLQFQARGTPRIEAAASTESDARNYFDQIRPLFEPARRHLLMRSA